MHFIGSSLILPNFRKNFKDLSHAPQRNQKDCLNCGSIVQGRFCQDCGQENIDHSLSTMGLIRHFFSDMVHFDGKYFKTIGTLITRPGYLSLAFLQGKRAMYVDPVKMYIFTSAFFFLVLFTFFVKLDPKQLKTEFKGYYQTPASLVRLLNEQGEEGNRYHLLNGYIIRNENDTMVSVGDKAALAHFRDSLNRTIGIIDIEQIGAEGPEFLSISGVTDHEDRQQYDSLQALLPDARRDGWLKRFLVYRNFAIQEDYKGRPGLYLAHVLERFMHSIPTVMFISLPLLALLLKLMYLRRRGYHYANHVIFLLHTYIHTYLFLLLFFLIVQLDRATGWALWGWMRTGLTLWVLWYLYRSMRAFYGQSKGLTVAKMGLFLIISSVILTFVFGSYFVYTALKG